MANILLIVSDTFRRDHIGAFNADAPYTPVLDAFAQTAICFDHHYPSSFPTMPARADILTGKFAFTFMGWEPLPANVQTVPALMSRAGYVTMGVVDTPFFVRSGFNYDRGFDDFIWIRGQGDELRPGERADTVRAWRTEADRFVAKTVTAAEEWLEDHYRERFFLYVDTWDPHEPWDAPAYYTSLFREGYDGREIYPVYGRPEAYGLTEEDVEVAHAAYCGEVRMVDRWIGRLLEKLDVLGIADDTIVLFVSDHGFYFGEHGYFGKADGGEYDPNAAPKVRIDTPAPVWLKDTWVGAWLLTLGWSPLHQEITRIPLMIRVPGVTPGRRGALTTAPDVAATVLDLAGVELPRDIGGRSLMGILSGETDELRPFVISSWPLYYAEGEATTAVDSRPRSVTSYMPITVSTRTWSAILGGPRDAPELYHLETDPGEQINVAAANPERLRSLLEGGLQFLREQGTDENVLRPREEAVEKLASGEVG